MAAEDSQGRAFSEQVLAATLNFVLRARRGVVERSGPGAEWRLGGAVGFVCSPKVHAPAPEGVTQRAPCQTRASAREARRLCRPKAG